MHFTCRSFNGKHSSTNWSQYWENEPDDSTLTAKKGHLFGLINLNLDSDSQEINNIGHDIIFEINQNYFSSDISLSILSSLEKTLSSVTTNPLFNFSKLTIILAVVLDSRLYFCIFGNGKIIVNRQKQISLILSGNEGKISTISGPLQSEDKVLLCTDSFYQQISWKRIKEILSDENIQSIEENFISSIYSLNDKTTIAGTLIQVHDFISPLPSDIPPPSPRKFKKSFIKRLFTPKPIIISHQDTAQASKHKKINIIIALILLICLIISAYFGYKKNKASQIESQYQSLKSELNKKFTNIAAVKNLNIDSALAIAKESETIIQKMTALNVHSQELSQYQSQIKSILSQTGSSDNFAPEPFYDTSLIVNNPQYSKITSDNNLLYLLDSSNGRIDSIDINQKSIKNISISDKIKTTTGFALNNGSLFTLNNEGLSLVTKNGPEIKVSFNDPDKIILPTSFNFWNGALYVLDSQNSAIWKYTPNSTGFSPPQTWLQTDQKLNSHPVSLAINGEIWVLSADGKVTPYAKGTKQEFKPSQENKITNASNLITSPDTDILAFVDADNLIYVYKKTGEVMAKYNFGNLKIAGLTLHSKTNTLFILCTDQKIYKINLH